MLNPQRLAMHPSKAKKSHLGRPSGSRWLSFFLEEEVVATQLLLLIKLGVELIDTRSEIGRITTESDIEVLQELVATGEQRLGSVGTSVDSWFTVKNDDSISEVGCHDEIVLDDEGGLL